MKDRKVIVIVISIVSFFMVIDLFKGLGILACLIYLFVNIIFIYFWPKLKEKAFVLYPVLYIYSAMTYLLGIFSGHNKFNHSISQIIFEIILFGFIVIGIYGFLKSRKKKGIESSISQIKEQNRKVIEEIRLEEEKEREKSEKIKDGYKLLDVEITCPGCDGSTFCPRCGRTGRCVRCGGNGYVDGHKCYTCYGRGICDICGGKGLCPECDGKGKIVSKEWVK